MTTSCRAAFACRPPRRVRATRTLAPVILIMLLAAAGLPAAAFARPVVLTDVLRQRHVASIDVSRDGRLAVIEVRSIEDVRDADAGTVHPRNQSHLYLADLEEPGAGLRRLTRGDRFDRAPVFSPDGRTIAFLRAGAADDPRAVRPDDAAENVAGPEASVGRAQVWLLPVAGGEPEQLTVLPHGASSPVFHPDGDRLLVASSIPWTELAIEGDAPPWGDERPNAAGAAPAEDADPAPGGDRDELRAWLEGNADERDPVVITRLDFQAEQGLAGPRTARHLFFVPIDETATGARDEPVRITRGYHDHLDAVFTIDGGSILFTGSRDETLDPDRVLDRGLHRMRLDGTGLRTLLPAGEWTVRRPRPSGDGTTVAFLAEPTRDRIAAEWRVGLLPLDTDASAPAVDREPPLWLTDETTFDHSVSELDWIPGKAALVFGAAVRGGFPLMTMSLGLLEPALHVDDRDDEHDLPVGVHAWGLGPGRTVYARTTITNPCELRVRDARGDRRLADLNPWTRTLDLSIPDHRTVERPDGTVVDAWLMPPTKRLPGQTYPLVLEIHGGPSAMWGPGERTMWHEFQLLCSWGYGVVYANPRGSGGYGSDFRAANREDWGFGPGGDVLAAVDDVLSVPWVDEERLVVTGGSYGGYLTAWVIAQDRRFRAAVAQRGVYELSTFHGEGNAWRLVDWYFGGAPWEQRMVPILRRESPMTWVARIRTPLLILHASQDLRTGVSQSEMLYRALKVLGRPVEYVRYPNAGHDLSRSGDPRQRMDRLGRILEFFERHVENTRRAPAPPRGND